MQEARDDFARVSAELLSAHTQIEWLESQASGIDAEDLLRLVDGKDRTLEEQDTEIERLKNKLEEADNAARRRTEVRLPRWPSDHEYHKRLLHTVTP